MPDELIHIDCLNGQDLPRFKQLGVAGCMQPRHCAPDITGQWATPVGPARWKYAWAFRSLRDSGATLAFASDWNVAEMEPLIGIYTALTRKGLDGNPEGGWVPEQTIDLETAIRAYTINGAYANFVEQNRGSITEWCEKEGLLPNVTFKSEKTIKLGGKTVELTGHHCHSAEGDLFIYVPEAKFLMVVDSVTSGYAPFQGLDLSTNFHEYMNTLGQSIGECAMKKDRPGINAAAKPSGDGCVECLAADGWWLHLRRSAQCGAHRVLRQSLELSWHGSGRRGLSQGQDATSDDYQHSHTWRD